MLLNYFLKNYLPLPIDISYQTKNHSMHYWQIKQYESCNSLLYLVELHERPVFDCCYPSPILYCLFIFQPNASANPTKALGVSSPSVWKVLAVLHSFMLLPWFPFFLWMFLLSLVGRFSFPIPYRTCLCSSVLAHSHSVHFLPLGLHIPVWVHLINEADDY